jgi:hypothetical protein
MDIAFSVDVVLFEGILVVISIRQQMRVETRVLEWTVALLLVEMLARNGVKCFCVLIDQCVLDFTFVDHPGAWNDEITILSTDRTGPVMSLLHLLVVGGSPVTNALKTECMGAVFKDSKLPIVLKHFFEADDAFFVSFILSVALFVSIRFWLGVCCQALGVHVLAVITISTVALLVEFTDYPVWIVIKEIIYDLIIIVAIIYIRLIWFAARPTCISDLVHT